jgi:hypothetical protein
MATLQELKEAREKLDREIAQAMFVEKETEKQDLINRLLLNLPFQPTMCQLPLKTVAHVKRIFGDKELCSSKCVCYETCKRIIELTGKKTVNSKGDSVSYSKKAVQPFKYQIIFTDNDNTANISITEPISTSYLTTKQSCKGFRKVLTDRFCKEFEVTQNQVSGLTKVLNMKGFKL